MLGWRRTHADHQDRRKEDSHVCEVQALIEAVYLAQREALRLPEWDRQIRCVEHKPEYFHVIPGTSENHVLVEVSMFSGRSLEAKRALYQGIVQRLARLGVNASDITIVLYEVPPEFVVVSLPRRLSLASKLTFEGQESLTRRWAS